MSFRSLSRAFAFIAVCGTAGLASAQVEIPLQPSGPLVDSSNGGSVSAVPSTTVLKSADSYSDDEVRALGQSIAFPYSLLDSVLDRFVTDKGDVVYLLLKNSNELALYERALALANTDNFPVFTFKDEKGGEVVDRNAELAFWVNAYNALFLKAVAEKFPVDSVGDISGLDEAKTRNIGGKNYSFAELRTKIAKIDPRALFLLLDGTNSGPRAPQRAARFAGLGAQMNEAVKAFVDDQTRVGSPNRDQNEVAVSPWLEGVDQYFKSGARKSRKHEGIRNILAGYTSNSADRRYFGAGEYQIRFLPANRKINAAIARG